MGLSSQARMAIRFGYRRIGSMDVGRATWLALHGQLTLPIFLPPLHIGMALLQGKRKYTTVLELCKRSLDNLRKKLGSKDKNQSSLPFAFPPLLPELDCLHAD